MRMTVTPHWRRQLLGDVVMALLMIPRLEHGGNPIRLPVGWWRHSSVVPSLEPLLWLFGVLDVSDGVDLWSTLRA
jgi:hypothetical protein